MAKKAAKPQRSQSTIWQPPVITKRFARAWQHMLLYQSGQEEEPLSPEECRVISNTLMNDICMTYQECYVHGQNDATHYMLGRRSVGLALATAGTVKPETLND